MLMETGLRYGDSCSLISPSLPRRNISLNRTQWDILPAGDVGTPGVPQIQIPGVKAATFKWRLHLESVAGEQRFLLKSLDGTPFSLNGQWGREAFLEGSDTLSLDRVTRLEFRRENRVAQLDPQPWPEALSDERVVASKLAVLIQGETGSGKSHLARELHRRSGRRGEFVALNIAALAPSLVEAELFGHKRGAFTGAHCDRAGALAQARGGTLFLDEVDSLTPELQLKLLLFLDSGGFRPVGALKEERTDARLVFAAGKRLENLVAAGLMRTDFFFRISQGVKLELTPLRFAPQEIVRHCQLFAIESNVTVSSRLLDFYKTLPWPGNIRQLRGHLQSKKVRSKTRKLDFDTWDEELLTMSSDLMGIAGGGVVRPMEEVKREYARQAFRLCHGELNRTARELQVNPKTLRVWLAD